MHTLKDLSCREFSSHFSAVPSIANLFFNTVIKTKLSTVSNTIFNSIIVEVEASFRSSTLTFQIKVFLKGSILKIKDFWPENKGFLGKLKGFTCGKKRFFYCMQLK